MWDSVDVILLLTTLPSDTDLAGEVIKYSWGCAKNYYRQLSLDKKKGKKISKKTVQEEIPIDNLTTKWVSIFLDMHINISLYTS